MIQESNELPHIINLSIKAFLKFLDKTDDISINDKISTNKTPTLSESFVYSEKIVSSTRQRKQFCGQ